MSFIFTQYSFCNSFIHGLIGLIISNDLTWRNQVDKVVKSCNSKQSGLWKCTHLFRKDQRKTKAEGVIFSRLNYCIEVVSQGRKVDLERLQSVQTKSARWVIQTRLQVWSLRGGLKKLGWLSMAQQAAYVSIKTALKVLQDSKPERLYRILTEENEGVTKRKVVDERKFCKMKASTRKAWSWRSLRWMEQMPESLKSGNISLKAVKKELKAWVKHHIPVRGDRILWGQPLTGDMKRRKAKDGEPDDEDGATEMTRQPERLPGIEVITQSTEPNQNNEQGGVIVHRTGESLATLTSLRRTQSKRKLRKYRMQKSRSERGEKMLVKVTEFLDEEGRCGAEGPRLPGSLAAAVKASLYESRETLTPGGHQPGENEGGMRTAAAVKEILQVKGEDGLMRTQPNDSDRKSKTDRKCKRPERFMWSLKEDLVCYSRCNVTRQGGHRGAVGRVKSGEG